MVVLVICAFAVCFALEGFGTCYLWNNIATTIFGLAPITFIQGYLISMLITWFKGIANSNSMTAEQIGEKLIRTIFADLIWLAIAWVFIRFM